MAGLHDDVDNDSLYAFFQSIACPATEVLVQLPTLTKPRLSERAFFQFMACPATEVYQKSITNPYKDASMCPLTQCVCVFVCVCERESVCMLHI